MRSVSTTLLLCLLGVFLLTACVERPGTDNPSPPQQSILVTTANETAAMARLRSIGVAEASYQAESGGEYSSLEQLVQKRYVNDPSSGKLSGYKFDVQVKSGGFQVTAVPEKYGITGKRSFYMDESYIIRAADKKGAPATVSDPEI